MESQSTNSSIRPILPDLIHKKEEYGKSNLHSDEGIHEKINLLETLSTETHPEMRRSIRHIGPPASCKKMVQMDLGLKDEFQGQRIRWRPYLALTMWRKCSVRYSVLTLASSWIIRMATIHRIAATSDFVPALR